MLVPPTWLSAGAQHGGGGMLPGATHGPMRYRRARSTTEKRYRMLLGLLWGILAFVLIFLWGWLFDEDPPGGVWPPIVFMLGVGLTGEWWAGTRPSQR